MSDCMEPYEGLPNVVILYLTVFSMFVIYCYIV